MQISLIYLKISVFKLKISAIKLKISLIRIKDIFNSAVEYLTIVVDVFVSLFSLGFVIYSIVLGYAGFVTVGTLMRGFFFCVAFILFALEEHEQR